MMNLIQPLKDLEFAVAGMVDSTNLTSDAADGLSHYIRNEAMRMEVDQSKIGGAIEAAASNNLRPDQLDQLYKLNYSDFTGSYEDAAMMMQVPAFAGLQDQFTEKYDLHKDSFGGALDRSKTNLKEVDLFLWDAYKEKAIAALSYVDRFLQGHKETFKEYLSSIGNTLKPFLDSWLDALPEILTMLEVIGTLLKPILTMLAEFSPYLALLAGAGLMATIPNQMYKMLGRASERIMPAGQEFGRGLTGKNNLTAAIMGSGVEESKVSFYSDKTIEKIKKMPRALGAVATGFGVVATSIKGMIMSMGPALLVIGAVVAALKLLEIGIDKYKEHKSFKEIGTIGLDDGIGKIEEKIFEYEELEKKLLERHKRLEELAVPERQKGGRASYDAEAAFKRYEKSGNSSKLEELREELKRLRELKAEYIRKNNEIGKSIFGDGFEMLNAFDNIQEVIKAIQNLNTELNNTAGALEQINQYQLAQQFEKDFELGTFLNQNATNPMFEGTASLNWLEGMVADRERSDENYRLSNRELRNDDIINNRSDIEKQTTETNILRSYAEDIVESLSSLNTIPDEYLGVNTEELLQSLYQAFKIDVSDLFPKIETDYTKQIDKIEVEKSPIEVANETAAAQITTGGEVVGSALENVGKLINEKAQIIAPEESDEADFRKPPNRFSGETVSKGIFAPNEVSASEFKSSVKTESILDVYFDDPKANMNILDEIGFAGAFLPKTKTPLSRQPQSQEVISSKEMAGLIGDLRSAVNLLSIDTSTSETRLSADASKEFEKYSNKVSAAISKANLSIEARMQSQYSGSIQTALDKIDLEYKGIDKLSPAEQTQLEALIRQRKEIEVLDPAAFKMRRKFEMDSGAYIGYGGKINDINKLFDEQKISSQERDFFKAEEDFLKDKYSLNNKIKDAKETGNRFLERELNLQLQIAEIEKNRIQNNAQISSEAAREAALAKKSFETTDYKKYVPGTQEFELAVKDFVVDTTDMERHTIKYPYDGDTAFTDKSPQGLRMLGMNAYEKDSEGHSIIMALLQALGYHKGGSLMVDKPHGDAQGYYGRDLGVGYLPYGEGKGIDIAKLLAFFGGGKTIKTSFDGMRFDDSRKEIFEELLSDIEADASTPAKLRQAINDILSDRKVKEAKVNSLVDKESQKLLGRLSATAEIDTLLGTTSKRILDVKKEQLLLEDKRNIDLVDIIDGRRGPEVKIKESAKSYVDNKLKPESILLDVADQQAKLDFAIMSDDTDAIKKSTDRLNELRASLFEFAKANSKSEQSADDLMNKIEELTGGMTELTRNKEMLSLYNDYYKKIGTMTDAHYLLEKKSIEKNAITIKEYFKNGEQGYADMIIAHQKYELEKKRTLANGTATQGIQLFVFDKQMQSEMESAAQFWYKPNRF